jgi:carboxyl-terminal processing protease
MMRPDATDASDPEPAAAEPDAEPAPEPAAEPGPPAATPPLPPAPAATRRSFVLAMAIAIVAILGGSGLFLSGYTLGQRAASEPSTPISEADAFRPFWDTYHTITDTYAGGTVDREALVQGAIKGMVGALGDPYSSYLTAQEYLASLQGISGQFEGVGAEISTQGSDGVQGCAPLGPACHLLVVSALDASPAEKAGVMAGDLILATDGTSLDGLTVDAARARVRGPKGSVVTLTIQRGTAAPFDLAVTRDVIQQQIVTSKVLAGGSVGYVRLSDFSDTAAATLRQAFAAHVQAGRTALILDLRGDPGGFVTAARAVASEFISSGVIFWEQDAKGGQLATDALPGGVATDPKLRIVCLIDGGSASASEIVAGALQDSKRATLIGQTSFGKGTVQRWTELTGEGGAVKLTIARWLTPTKRWIHGVGLTPDIVVDVPANTPAGSDPILDKALQVLGGAAAGPVLLAAA